MRKSHDVTKINSLSPQEPIEFQTSNPKQATRRFIYSLVLGRSSRDKTTITSNIKITVFSQIRYWACDYEVIIKRIVSWKDVHVQWRNLYSQKTQELLRKRHMILSI